DEYAVLRRAEARPSRVAVLQVVGLATAAPGRHEAGRVGRRDPREVGEVVIRRRDARRAETDIRRQGSIDDLDADVLQLGLDDRLLRGAGRVRRSPREAELRRIPGALPGPAGAADGRRAARAVLLQQRKCLRPREGALAVVR